MRKLVVIIITLFIIHSCKTSSHKCDAYGAKENFTKKDRV